MKGKMIYGKMHHKNIGIIHLKNTTIFLHKNGSIRISIHKSIIDIDLDITENGLKDIDVWYKPKNIIDNNMYLCELGD